MVSRTFDRLPEATSRLDVRYGTDSTLIVIPSLRRPFAILQDFVIAAIFLPVLGVVTVAGLRNFVAQVVVARAPSRELILGSLIGVVWTALSLILCAGILYSILWRLWGEERIEISYKRLKNRVTAGSFRRTRSFPLDRILSVRSKMWADHRQFPGESQARFERGLTHSLTTWSDASLMLIFEPEEGGSPKRVYFGRELNAREQSVILVEIDKYRFPEIHWGAGFSPRRTQKSPLD